MKLRQFRGFCVCITLTLLLFTASGCLVFNGKDEAEKTVQKLYTAIQRGDYNTALDLYSNKFYEKTSRSEWGKMLKNINNKLGDVKEYKSNGWRVNTTTSGTFIMLNYEVKYTKYSAVESFNIQKEGKTYKIVGHNINSEGFLKE